MIKYQVGASIRELFGLRFRTLLLILQVIVVAATLAATLNDTLRSIDDISVAHSLEGRDVLYFTKHYDEARPPDINETMAGVLRETLDGKNEDYTIVKNNYFEGGHIQAPVLVALGGFAQAYGLPASSNNTETVLIGARVGAYEVGDSLTFGDRQVSVAGRLSPGTAYLDPWMGYESLDEHVVLLSTYERFAATTAPGVWQEEAVGRTVLFDPTDKAVEEYVSAAGSTGGIGVIPQRLDERVATVYEAQLSRSGMFLVFFGCLLLVLVGTATSAVDALVGSNLRRYAIEQCSSICEN